MDDLEQMILGNLPLPNPYPADQIKPELLVFRNMGTSACKDQSLPYKWSIEEAVKRLKTEGFLDKINRVVFIVHGFLGNLKSPWMYQMKDALLETEDEMLVVLVGWGGGADIGLLSYPEAVVNTQTVSNWLSGYVTALHASIDNVNIYGIGHSLGAHVIGQTGRLCEVFDRITALDPAGPMFESRDDTQCLLPTDAKMVDCIHTDGYDPDWQAELCPINHFGTLLPWGTIDFYPHFGLSPQPGIDEFNPYQISKSHQRSHDYFIWSIKHPDKFLTNQKLNKAPGYEEPVKDVHTTSHCAQMGFYCDKVKVTSGQFYVKVNSSEPWEDLSDHSWWHCTLQ